MKFYPAGADHQIFGDTHIVGFAPGVQMKRRQMGVTDKGIKALPVFHKLIEGTVTGEVVPVDGSEHPFRLFKTEFIHKFNILFFGQPEKMPFVYIMPADETDPAAALLFEVLQRGEAPGC